MFAEVLSVYLEFDETRAKSKQNKTKNCLDNEPGRTQTIAFTVCAMDLVSSLELVML